MAQRACLALSRLNSGLLQGMGGSFEAFGRPPQTSHRLPQGLFIRINKSVVWRRQEPSQSNVKSQARAPRPGPSAGALDEDDLGKDAPKPSPEPWSSRRERVSNPTLAELAPFGGLRWRRHTGAAPTFWRAFEVASAIGTVSHAQNLDDDRGVQPVGPFIPRVDDPRGAGACFHMRPGDGDVKALGFVGSRLRRQREGYEGKSRHVRGGFHP